MTDGNSWIVDVDASTFEKQVIERSLTQPVVVDFWAEWCEPCKTLGPMLERRAVEGNGRFLLAKINIDKCPELAEAFRVQGIPAVIAVVRGQIADGFEGAVPEEKLDEFLQRVAGSQTTPDEDVLAAVQADIEAGRIDAAIETLREHLVASPEHAAARFLLVDVLVDASRADEAAEVFAKLTDEERDSPEGKVLATRLAFAESSDDLDDLVRAVESGPGSIDARMALGKALVAQKEFERGLEELLEAYRLASMNADANAGTAAKSAMLETFDVLGLEDPIANDYRFKLSLELFA